MIYSSVLFLNEIIKQNCNNIDSLRLNFVFNVMYFQKSSHHLYRSNKSKSSLF